jgi:hypothetical protein
MYILTQPNAEIIELGVLPGSEAAEFQEMFLRVFFKPPPMYTGITPLLEESFSITLYVVRWPRKSADFTVS